MGLQLLYFYQLKYGHKLGWKLFEIEKALTARAHYNSFLFPSLLSSNLNVKQQVQFIITLPLLSFYIWNAFFYTWFASLICHLPT